ncbi:hypothetical protein [Cellulomonas sp. NS3]|uniref:hypothetical protein n=1 Tax=Cellulomonas sp. NS3 TaxID=2973977 RepID=UPI0021634EBA|nr:hypothetical protein [Cellulomonas sp. NS3]
MHPALVRLPVAVALALPLVGASTLALPAPAAAAAVHQDTAEHEATSHDHAATQPSPGTPADDPALDPAAPTRDAPGAEPMAGTDHADAGEGSTHEEGHDSGNGSDEVPADTGVAGGHDETTGEHAESGGHAEENAAPVARPRAAVLSTFVGVNAAVLIAAAVLRRRDGNRPRHRPRPAGTPTTA